MKTKICLVFFCILFACASTFELQDNPYTEAIEKYGEPRQAVWQDEPPDPEVLLFDTCMVVIEYPVKVWFFYIPPKLRPNDLRISVTDTSNGQDHFCLEFEIDGLVTRNHTTLYQIGIFSQEGRKQSCLYTSLPIEGTRGLRAVQITVFVPIEYVEGIDLILIQAMDVLTGEMRKGIIKL